MDDLFEYDDLRRVWADTCLAFPHEVFREKDLKAFPGLSKRMHDLIDEAELVIWNGEIYRLSLNKSEAFIGIEPQRDVCPVRPQFWFPNKNIEFPRGEPLFEAYARDSEITHSRLYCMAFVIAPEPEGFTSFAFWVDIDQGNKLQIRAFGKLRYGSPVGEFEAINYASMSFLKQRIVSIETERLSRGDRRRLEKQGKPEPTIRVVTLRKREQKAMEGAAKGQPSDWSCQWLVGAHWRKNHWDENRPIFVTDYLKGPTDKPFRAPKSIVYKAKR